MSRSSLLSRPFATSSTLEEVRPKGLPVRWDRRPIRASLGNSSVEARVGFQEVRFVGVVGVEVGGEGGRVVSGAGSGVVVTSGGSGLGRAARIRNS